MSLKSSDVQKIVSRVENLIKTLNKGNPYHDKLGRFTWSPFGKYSGNPYEAVSIWGSEYKKAIKGFADTLTPEEEALVEEYADSPALGNSSQKNSGYERVNMFFDKDGNELSESEIAEAKELYGKDDPSFDEKYSVLKNQLVPAPWLNVISESYMKSEGFFTDSDELVSKAESILSDGVKDKMKQLYEESGMDEHDIAKRIELFGDGGSDPTVHEFVSGLSDNEKTALCVLYGQDGLKGKPNHEVRDVFKYPVSEDDNHREYTTYPNSGVKAKGITPQYLEKFSDEKLIEYEKMCRAAGYTSTAEACRQEMKGRQLDKLIMDKGISFDKDIVVTRRVSTMSVINQEIGRMGYYTQSGFTSTCAANNLMRESPGGMRFGNNIIKIVIPAGTKILPVESSVRKMTDLSSGSPYEIAGWKKLLSQHEFLLPSNTKYIGSDKNNPKQLRIEKPSSYSPTLQLDKVNYNLDEVFSMVAITDQYQRSR